MVGSRARGGRRRRTAGVLLTMLVGGACTNYVDEPGGAAVPVVLSIVVAGADSAFVALGRSGPGTTTGPERRAALSLEARGRTVPLAETPGEASFCGGPDRFTCYVAALPEPLAPGDVVLLRGSLSSGEQVRGSTQVPPVPRVEVGGHVPGDTVRFTEGSTTPPRVLLQGGTGRVAGRDTMAAASYWAGGGPSVCSVWILSPTPLVDLRALPSSSVVQVSLSAPVCAGQAVTEWDSLTAPLVILGFDAHATAWYDTDGEFWPTEATTWGVHGAVGLFGSATPASLILHMTARRAAGGAG